MHTAQESSGYLYQQTLPASSDVNTSMLMCRGILWDVCINLHVVKLITGNTPWLRQVFVFLYTEAFFTHHMGS